MALRFESGNIFESKADYLVNAVNCVGVMGAGIALQFRNKYPDMYQNYKMFCSDGKLKPGVLHVWNNVVNLPTKRHWRNKSRYDDVEKGLVELKKFLVQNKVKSIALPMLGCGYGGLKWSNIKELILKHLDNIDTDVIVLENN